MASRWRKDNTVITKNNKDKSVKSVITRYNTA